MLIKLFHFLMSLTQEKNSAHRDLFHFYTSLKLKVNYACRFHFYTSLKLKLNYACKNLIHFLTSLTQKWNYAHKVVSFLYKLETESKLCLRLVPTQHDVQRLLVFPHYNKITV